MIFKIIYRMARPLYWAHTQILYSFLPSGQPVFIPVVPLRGIQLVPGDVPAGRPVLGTIFPAHRANPAGEPAAGRLVAAGEPFF